MQLRLDVETIIGSAYPSFIFGGRNSAGQQFLTSAFSYKFSFSSGQTVGQFPNCTKPRTLYKRLAALAFCTTRCGCTAVAQSSPSGRPSYNCGFAKFRKKILASLDFFRNFAKPQRVVRHTFFISSLVESQN